MKSNFLNAVRLNRHLLGDGNNSRGRFPTALLLLTLVVALIFVTILFMFLQERSFRYEHLPENNLPAKKGARMARRSSASAGFQRPKRLDLALSEMTRQKHNSAQVDCKPKTPQLASVLPQQVSENAFFAEPDTNYSSFYCNSPHSGGIDVFGKRFNHLHYCVIRNACFSGSSMVLYPRRAEGEKQSIQSYKDLPHLIFRSGGVSYIDKTEKGRTHLINAMSECRYIRGLTAYVSSSYGMKHLTHFMEPMIQLFQTLIRFGYFKDNGREIDPEAGYMTHPLGALYNNSNDPSSTNYPMHGYEGGVQENHAIHYEPFGLKYASLDRMLVYGLRGSPAKHSWPEYFLTMLYANRRRRTEKTFIRNLEVDHVSRYSGKCFEELVMVGSSYNPFEEVHLPSWIRQRDWFLGFIDDAEQVEKETDQLPGLLLRASGSSLPVRRILVCHRNSGRRSIHNSKEFNKWLTGVYPGLDKDYQYEVRSVVFGSLSPRQQALAAHWADILIGVHGADLTNVVYMNPNKVLLELNPLFFFEPRFVALADSVQVHYNAWTCTHQSCTRVWGETVRSGSGYTYDHNRGFKLDGRRFTSGSDKSKYQLSLIQSVTSDDGWFVWPTQGYVGDDCVGCDLLSCCTRMSTTLLSTQRDSQIFLTQVELGEIAAAIRRSARLVGTPVPREKQLSYEERVDRARAARARRQSA